MMAFFFPFPASTISSVRPGTVRTFNPDKRRTLPRNLEIGPEDQVPVQLFAGYGYGILDILNPDPSVKNTEDRREVDNK